MTTDCTRLDAYRDGRLAEPDAQAFESHASTCVICEDALLADDLGLAVLADVACPPAVLEAAFAAAAPRRVAPDRPAARVPRRFGRLRLVPVAMAAALAVAAALFVWPSPDPALREVAVVETPAPETVPAPVPAPLPDPDLADAAPEAVAPAPPAPATPRTRPAPTPRRAAPLAPPPGDAAPVDIAAVPDPAPDIEPEPTDAEIAAARRDLAIAFATLADAQDLARNAVRGEARDVYSTLDTALPFYP